MGAEHTSVWNASVDDPAGLWVLRRACTDQLRVWACDDEDIDAVLLIVSELATNAFLHGLATAADVCLRQVRDVLDIEVAHWLHASVSDADRSAPQPPTADAAAAAEEDTPRIGGRGLLIVRALSHAYEVDVVDGRRIDRAWFVLGRNGPDSG